MSFLLVSRPDCPSQDANYQQNTDKPFFPWTMWRVEHLRGCSSPPVLALLCSCSLVGAMGCEGNIDSLSRATSAGWAPAAFLVVCNLSWTHWLAQVYKKNPSPCKKQQWFCCLFSPGTSVSATAGQFFIMKVPAKPWNPSLFYCRPWCAFRDWAAKACSPEKKQKTTQNTKWHPYWKKMRVQTLTFFGILLWQTSCHLKQPSQRSWSSQKDQQTALAVIIWGCSSICAQFSVLSFALLKFLSPPSLIRYSYHFAPQRSDIFPFRCSFSEQ